MDHMDLFIHIPAIGKLLVVVLIVRTSGNIKG